MVDSWIVTPMDPDDSPKNYLTYRCWDGFDKPEYYRFFEIEKSERDLCSGRFSKFVGWIDFFDSNIRCIKIPRINKDEMMRWIFENIKSKWGMSLEDADKNDFTMNFYIEKEEEAAAFKLTWG